MMASTVADNVSTTLAPLSVNSSRNLLRLRARASMIASGYNYELEVRGESIRPLYLLIYGRRAEANKTVERQRLRSNMSRNDEFLMTYDRLVPQAGASEFYTVRVDRSGYHALYVPVTSTIGPLFARERATIRDKDIAISNSPYFSADRRAFYLSRQPYWDDWAVNGRRGIIYTGDRE